MGQADFCSCAMGHCSEGRFFCRAGVHPWGVVVVSHQGPTKKYRDGSEVVTFFPLEEGPCTRRPEVWHCPCHAPMRNEALHSGESGRCSAPAQVQQCMISDCSKYSLAGANVDLGNRVLTMDAECRVPETVALAFSLELLQQRAVCAHTNTCVTPSPSLSAC